MEKTTAVGVCVNRKRPLLYAAIKGRFVCLKVSLLLQVFLACPGYWEKLCPTASPAPALPAPGRFSWKAGQERGRAASDPAEGSLSPSPFPLALLWLLPGQAARRTPAPRGATRGTSGAAAPQTSGAAAAHPPGPRLEAPAPGAARAGSETPAGGEGRRRRGCEGGTGKGSPATPLPAAGRAGVKAGRAAAGQGGRLSDIAG